MGKTERRRTYLLVCAAMSAPTSVAAQACGGTTTIVTFANGELIGNFEFDVNHHPTREVVQWLPSSAEARSVRMSGRWEAQAPATIDWSRGLAMFDSERLWSPSGRRPPGGLALELRANPTPPWEGYGALRGTTKLQFGVRLSADWADVRAFATGSEPVYLLTRRKQRVLDTVQLHRGDFDFPLDVAGRALDEARGRAAALSRTCVPETDIIVTNVASKERRPSR